MIIDILIRLMQMLALGALQVLLMNHLHFAGYGTPLVYVALLLYVRANASRSATLVWAFLMGLAMDAFSNTPGMAAAAMTLAAFFQPALLKVYLPKDALEDMVPTYRTMGVWTHLRYLTLLLLVHHLAYFFIESFSFFNLAETCIQALCSFVSTWVVLALMETLRGNRKERF